MPEVIDLTVSDEEEMEVDIMNRRNTDEEPDDPRLEFIKTHAFPLISQHLAKLSSDEVDLLGLGQKVCISPYASLLCTEILSTRLHRLLASYSLAKHAASTNSA